MWVRKTTTELASKKRISLLRNICLVLLAWAGIWYVLSQFRQFLGQPLGDSTAGLMGIALLGAITLIWGIVWQERLRCMETWVCEQCNAVKSADGQPACKCGGHYLNLLEIKWIKPVPPKPAQAIQADKRLLASNSP